MFKYYINLIKKTTKTFFFSIFKIRIFSNKKCYHFSKTKSTGIKFKLPAGIFSFSQINRFNFLNKARDKIMPVNEITWDNIVSICKSNSFLNTRGVNNYKNSIGGILFACSQFFLVKYFNFGLTSYKNFSRHMHTKKGVISSITSADEERKEVPLFEAPLVRVTLDSRGIPVSFLNNTENSSENLIPTSSVFLNDINDSNKYIDNVNDNLSRVEDKVKGLSTMIVQQNEEVKEAIDTQISSAFREYNNELIASQGVTESLCVNLGNLINNASDSTSSINTFVHANLHPITRDIDSHAQQVNNETRAIRRFNYAPYVKFIAKSIPYISAVLTFIWGAKQQPSTASSVVTSTEVSSSNDLNVPLNKSNTTNSSSSDYSSVNNIANTVANKIGFGNSNLPGDPFS